MNQAGSGGSAGSYDKYMKQYAGSYAAAVSPAASTPTLLKQELQNKDSTEEQKKGLDSSAGGSAGSYDKYMQQYAGDYSKYMQHGGTGSSSSSYDQYMKQYAGDYSKYMKQAGSGGSAGSYDKYMKQYAGDYSKYMNQAGSGG